MVNQIHSTLKTYVDRIPIPVGAGDANNPVSGEVQRRDLSVIVKHINFHTLFVDMYDSSDANIYTIEITSNSLTYMQNGHETSDFHSFYERFMAQYPSAVFPDAFYLKFRYAITGAPAATAEEFNAEIQFYTANQAILSMAMTNALQGELAQITADLNSISNNNSTDISSALGNVQDLENILNGTTPIAKELPLV